ncbi:MAG: FAD-dependent oxidoreductase [Clostridia bacterium]|nr:FAD-dependent oxidoreductase [Clostridia bacterium]MBQ9785698.1 FAD-dependent oxidoreductase [Clostridia bacterium]
MRHYDIVVVGGGFAGAAAGISAARRGKNVLLIEKYNCMGGAAAFDLVNPFMPYWTWDPTEPQKRHFLSRGLFEEIVARLVELGGAKELDCLNFNEELLKYLLNTMACEAGLHLLYDTCVTGAETRDGRITALTVSNVSGTQRITADCFVDATGDANLVHLARLPYRVGRAGDGLCQPMTLCFRLANVHAPLSGGVKRRINALYKEWQAAGKIKNPREDVLIFPTLLPGVYHFNATRVVKLDPTNAEDVTRAEIEAREQVIELYKFLRENFEEFSESVLLSTGMQIGARESRMIEGEYTLTQEDLLAFRKFEDSIAVCNYDIDIHSPDGSGTSHYYFPKGEYYGIPYRALIPKGVENLLVAGRCISTTHEAQASVRIMPTCCNTGEAAGVAAALSLDAGGKTRDVDVNALRAILIENGARVD